jgi:hypothetical protein
MKSENLTEREILEASSRSNYISEHNTEVID